MLKQAKGSSVMRIERLEHKIISIEKGMNRVYASLGIAAVCWFIVLVAIVLVTF